MDNQEIAEVKVYLDANIIFDPSKVDNIEQKEFEALVTLSKSPKVKFFVSEKVKKELKKHKNPKKQAYFIFLYNLIQKIPEENIMKSGPGTVGAAVLNSFCLNGGSGAIEDPLFTKLKQIFDKDDAELIFQAEKNKMNYFLTLDKKTILNRLLEKDRQLKEISLKIKIVSPSQLAKELKLNKL